MNSVKVVRHIALTYVLVRKRTYEADVRVNIEVRIRKETSTHARRTYCLGCEMPRRRIDRRPHLKNCDIEPNAHARTIHPRGQKMEKPKEKQALVLFGERKRLVTLPSFPEHSPEEVPAALLTHVEAAFEDVLKNTPSNSSSTLQLEVKQDDWGWEFVEVCGDLPDHSTLRLSFLGAGPSVVRSLTKNAWFALQSVLTPFHHFVNICCFSCVLYICFR